MILPVFFPSGAAIALVPAWKATAWLAPLARGKARAAPERAVDCPVNGSPSLPDLFQITSTISSGELLTKVWV